MTLELFNEKTRTHCPGWFVELVGFEPTSKQAAKMLSTCLAFSWGFGNEPGKGDPIPYLSP